MKLLIRDVLPHLWFAASDGSGPDGARFLVPAEDFGHAAVGHAQLARDDARPDAVMGHLHDFVPDVVGQRSAVDEDSAELVDPTLPQRRGNWTRRTSQNILYSKNRLQV